MITLLLLLPIIVLLAINNVGLWFSKKVT